MLLNALFGWWWADPVAGLVMVPIIAKEGVDGTRRKLVAGMAVVIEFYGALFPEIRDKHWERGVFGPDCTPPAFPFVVKH